MEQIIVSNYWGNNGVEQYAEIPFSCLGSSNYSNFSVFLTSLPVLAFSFALYWKRGLPH